jgi:hypothetical protein
MAVLSAEFKAVEFTTVEFVNKFSSIEFIATKAMLAIAKPARTVMRRNPSTIPMPISMITPNQAN